MSEIYSIIKMVNLEGKEFVIINSEYTIVRTEAGFYIKKSMYPGIKIISDHSDIQEYIDFYYKEKNNVTDFKIIKDDEKEYVVLKCESIKELAEEFRFRIIEIGISKNNISSFGLLLRNMGDYKIVKLFSEIKNNDYKFGEVKIARYSKNDNSGILLNEYLDLNQFKIKAYNDLKDNYTYKEIIKAKYTFTGWLDVENILNIQERDIACNNFTSYSIGKYTYQFCYIVNNLNSL